MKTSLVFYPNLSKTNFKTGMVPIYLRICFQAKKAETRLNVSLKSSDLPRWDPISMRTQERNSPINHYLGRIEQKFNEFLILHADNLSEFTAVAIRDHILGLNSRKQVKATDFLNEYFAQAVVNNVDRTAATVKNYRRSINHFVNFLKVQKDPEMTLSNLTFEFASDFKNYLVSSNTSLGRVGMTEVSAAGVIKKFRTIFSYAVDRELINNNPFKQVKIKTKSPRRERLSLAQVSQIAALDLSFYPHQILYRDLFLFSVFTGLAYHDLSNLTWKNLHERQDGMVKLSIARVKTDVLTECFLPSQAIALVNKYKNQSEVEITGLVFPRRSNKEFNSQLKLLATLAKIPIKLSTHIGRHTFRQLLAEAGVEDYGVIKRLMGQSRNGDVDEVYYSVTESRLMAAVKKLDLCLTQNLLLSNN